MYVMFTSYSNHLYAHTHTHMIISIHFASNCSRPGILILVNDSDWDLLVRAQIIVFIGFIFQLINACLFIFCNPRAILIMNCKTAIRLHSYQHFTVANKQLMHILLNKSHLMKKQKHIVTCFLHFVLSNTNC